MVKVISALGAVVLVACLAPSRAEAVPLTVCFSASPSAGCESQPAVTTTVGVGQTFSLFMVVDGAVDLSAWNLGFGELITWDSTYLSLVSTSDGAFFRDANTCAGGSPCATLFDPGIPTSSSVTAMSGNFVDPLAGATGTGSIAVFTFQALALTASTPLTFVPSIEGFSPFVMQDTAANFFFDAATLNGSIEIAENVAPVPEPGTMLLLGGGLIALARRRVRQIR